MRKLLIATAAAAGLLALGACANPADEDQTTADAATDEATDAAAGTAAGAGSGGGSGNGSGGGAPSADDAGSDASAPGGMAGGDAAPGSTGAPASDDPLVTGQGSMREGDPTRGNIDMPSEPAHPARQ